MTARDTLIRSALAPVATLFPAVVVFPWLVWSAGHDTIVSLAAIPLIALDALVPLALVLVSRRRAATSLRPLRAAALTLCALAPLGLLYPWAIVPTHFGAGFASLAFFLRWLTRYPNFGPVNYEILCGILCLLGTALVPVALATHAALSRGVSRRVAVGYLAAFLLAFAPVAVRLDRDLWRAGIHGMTTLWGNVAAPYAALGPLTRVLSLAAIVALVLRPDVSRSG